MAKPSASCAHQSKGATSTRATRLCEVLALWRWVQHFELVDWNRRGDRCAPCPATAMSVYLLAT